VSDEKLWDESLTSRHVKNKSIAVVEKDYE